MMFEKNKVCAIVYGYTVIGVVGNEGKLQKALEAFDR
ncbi:hypothetical protein SDC9_92570 [bioreactor metagenome]|uniref:Uncharacterized protein n=1 Tax=bioreactor metagenome TaxID=1076179 RepID=A0A644ZZK3_9ZZZZ